MRRSPRSFGLAVLAAFLAFMPATSVFAAGGEVDGAADDSEIEAAGADPDPQFTGKNLNTIPEDGMTPANIGGPDNLLVRQLLAARPNEDLVICVAGCFSGRDRVVYAQPAEKLLRKPAGRQQSQLSLPAPSQNPISVQPGNSILKPSMAASAEPQVKSQDPAAPVILNPTN